MAAAALVQHSLPRAKPTSSAAHMLSPKIDMYGLNNPTKEQDAQWEKLHSQPWEFFNDQVIAVIDEAMADAA